VIARSGRWTRSAARGMIAMQEGALKRWVLVVLAAHAAPAFAEPVAVAIGEQTVHLEPEARIRVHNRMGFAFEGWFSRVEDAALHVLDATCATRKVQLHLVERVEVLTGDSALPVCPPRPASMALPEDRDSIGRCSTIVVAPFVASKLHLLDYFHRDRQTRDRRQWFHGGCSFLL